MNLVLYSGGDNTLNDRLDRELFKMVENKCPVMLYIPFHPDESPRHFKEFCRYYKKYGVKRFYNFLLPLDNGPRGGKMTKEMRGQLMSADIIYLSGGNTFTFLDYLRQSGLRRHLKNFISRGGVMAGTSAGAILMTPNIYTAQVPRKDSDPNTTKVKNFLSLNFVPFEFSPHYESCKQSDLELADYSRSTPYPIFCCDDGAGIVMKGGKIKTVGKIIQFKKGKKKKFSSRSFGFL